jgi:hypothetical protein
MGGGHLSPRGCPVSFLQKSRINITKHWKREAQATSRVPLRQEGPEAWGEGRQIQKMMCLGSLTIVLDSPKGLVPR